MRSAKETGCFPYNSSVVCYFEIFPDGNVKQLTNKNEKLDAYVNANSGKSTIYAVWPGKWRSPIGLPMLAAWTIGQMQRFRYFMQDAVYG